MKFLLDTNVLVHLTNKSRGFERINDRLRDTGIEQCAISALTAYELRYMILRGPGRVRKENIELLKAGFASVRHVLPVTGAVAEAAAGLRVELQTKGRDIGLNDCLIAAHALQTNLACVTAPIASTSTGCAASRWPTGRRRRPRYSPCAPAGARLLVISPSAIVLAWSGAAESQGNRGAWRVPVAGVVIVETGALADCQGSWRKISAARPDRRARQGLQ